MKKIRIGYYLVRLFFLLVGLFFGGYLYTTFMEVI